MRKIILVLSITFAFFSSCTKEKNVDILHLKGQIKGLQQGKLYIQKVKDTNVIVIDSIIFKGKDTFETTLPIKSAEMLYLYLDKGQTNSIDNSLPFFAEPGTITINTTLKRFFSDATIKGSENHNLWQEFNRLNNKFSEENLKIIQKRLENEMNFNQQRQDSIEKAYKILVNRKYGYIANFAVTHSDYELAPYLALSEIPDINIAYLDSIALKMTDKVAQSKYGKLLQKHIASRKNEATK